MTAKANTIAANAPDNCPLGTEAEAERRALNRAFRAMGLPWYWEVADYRELLDRGGTAARVRRYVETRHAALLTAYDAEFLGRMVGSILERVSIEDAEAAPALQLVGRGPDIRADRRTDRRGWSPGSHSVDFIA